MEISEIWKIAKQKRLPEHFILGILVAIVSHMFLNHNGWETNFAILFVIGVGIAKELVYDMWWKKGVPDWWDFAATVLGGILVLVIL